MDVDGFMIDMSIESIVRLLFKKKGHHWLAPHCRNWFMLISVVMAVCASLKALHDARARALAAAGSDQEYEKRERDFMLYSSSQDSTIRCWNVKDGHLGVGIGWVWRWGYRVW